MPTTEKVVKGQLLSLLREIHVGDSTGAAYIEEFLIGFRKSAIPVFRSGIAFNWWYTQKGCALAKGLTKLIRDFHLPLIAIDLSSAGSALKEALQDNALNKFLLEDVSKKITQRKSLFDCYAPATPEQMASILFDSIAQEINKLAANWLFVYPLQRLRFSTHKFQNDEIAVLAAEDKTAWDEFRTRYPELKTLNPVAEEFYGGTFPFRPAKERGWLLINCRGNPSFAFDVCRRKAAVFLGVLFSVVEEMMPGHAFAKSSADVDDHAANFSDSSQGPRMQWAHCGVLLHSVAGAHDLPSEVLQRVDSWYESRQSAADENRNRAMIAARFLNDAAVTNGYKQFLAFFFALDALFGVRGDVERKIAEGIQRHISESGIKQKCEWLFDLRSELVHGGTASVEEWNGLEKYEEHFGSTPERDIQTIASHCLLDYFK